MKGFLNKVKSGAKGEGAPAASAAEIGGKASRVDAPRADISLPKGKERRFF